MLLFQATEPGEEPPRLPGADDFDARRQRQWEIGATARRANAHLGVLTDPAENGQRACSDSANYAEECVRQGDATAEELEWAYGLILQLDQWFGVVMERRRRSA